MNEQQASESEKTFEISDAEYLIAWISQESPTQQDINIYGNPAGLRELAAKLIAMADFDQTQGGFPENDSEHHHFNTGCNTDEAGQFPRLTIGRVDTKLDTTKLRDCFPPLVLGSNLKAIR